MASPPIFSFYHPTLNPQSSSVCCSSKPFALSRKADCVVTRAIYASPYRKALFLKNIDGHGRRSVILRSTLDEVSVLERPPLPPDEEKSLLIASLKLKLLSLVSGLNRGLAAGEEDLRKADAAAKELEAAGGLVDLSCDIDKLQGRWKIIYSSAFSSRTLGGSRPGPPTGRLLPITLGQVFQRIDVFSKDFDNIVELEVGAPWPLPPLEVTATLAHKFELTGSAKIRITFDKTTIKTAGNLSQLPPLEVPRIPDALRPPSNTGTGDFEVTYIDDDTRITRGDRGELRARDFSRRNSCQVSSMDVQNPAANPTSPGSSSTRSLIDEEETDIFLRLTKTVLFKVKKSDTIENLKALIQEKDDISKSAQDIFYDGSLLTDSRKLVDCGIQRNSILHLNVQSSRAVQIFVKILSHRKTVILEAAINDTVRTVKLMIQAKEGIQLHDFVLYYGGNLLEDDKTLACCNMGGVSILSMVFNPKEVISVSVRAPNGHIVELQPKCMFTIHAVKEIVEGMIGYSVNNGFLFYVGKQLDHGKTLAFYEVKEGSLLKLLPPTFQVFIKTWSGKTLTLSSVKQSDTVEFIKTEVFKRLMIPVHVQSIVYAGKRLENDRTLESYDIQEQSTLNMVLAPSVRHRLEEDNHPKHKVR